MSSNDSVSQIFLPSNENMAGWLSSGVNCSAVNDDRLINRITHRKIDYSTKNFSKM